MKDGAKSPVKRGKSTKTAQFEQQMRDLVNYNLDGILVIGMDGIALFANPAVCSLLNRPLESILDQEIGLPLSGEDYTEIEIHRPDGTSRTVEMRAHRIEWAGQPAWLADLRDITERKQAQEALWASEEKMSSIFRVAPTGIGVVRDRVLLDVNERICEMTGYAKGELIGQSARMLYPTQEDFDFVGREKYRQIAEGGTGQVETRWLKKDGAIIDVLLASTPIDVEDLSKGVTFTALDITERKKAADALLESHDRLHTILDSIDADIYVADLNTYEILFMNQHIRKSFGDNLVGLSCWQMFRGESGRCPNCTNDRLLDTDGNPTGLIVWEGQNPITGKSYINHDRAIKWTDGRLVHLQIATDITARIQAEKALRQSEERFRMLFDKAPLGYQSLDEDGRFIDVNQAWLDTMGYSREEVLGRWFGEFLSPEYVDAFRKRFPLFKAAGQIHSEFQMLHKDGSKHWIAFDGRIGYELNGEFKQTHCILQDITERKNAEESLRESEDKFKYVFDNSTVAKSLTRIDGTLHVNQAFCEMVGYSEEELENKSWREISHPDDVDLNLREVNEILSGAKESARFIKRYIHKNGSVVWVDISTSLRRDADGNPLYFITTALDITERKRAEEALRQEQQFSQLVIDSLPGIFYLYTYPEHRLVLWNKQFETLLGFSNEEMKDRFVMDWHLPQAKDAVLKTIEEVMEKGQSSIESPLVAKDGHLIPFFLTGVRFEVRDRLYYMGIGMDITDRKQAEESIRQSEWQMKALLTSLDDIVFEFDKDGTYLNIWAADESLLAMPKAQMLGKQVLEVMGRELGTQFAKAIKLALTEDAPQSIEYPLDVTGGRRWFMARVSPIFLSTGGSIHTASVLVRDITERKRIEEQVQVQLQRMRALNEIDRAISSSMDLHLSLDILLNEVLSQLEVDAASILLLNPFSQTIEYVAGKGFRTQNIRQSRMRLGEGLAGRVGLERKVLHIPDLNVMGSQFRRRDLLKEENFVEYFGVPLIAKGTLNGVLEIFHRSQLNPAQDWLNYLETLGGQAAIAIDNVQLFEGIQQSNRELVTAYDATIEGWSRAMDLRDKETEGHTQRVTELTVQLAKKMGISQQEIVQMRRGALLHDVGKLGVPDNILLKPDALTKIEWAVMRQHPSYAFNMLMSINYLRPALDIPYCHHEKWDGTGYPRGLKGHEIPIAARLFAIIDVWDALRSDRPYRAGWTIEKTREYIVEQSGKHFDPQVVEAFLSLLDESPDLK